MGQGRRAVHRAPSSGTGTTQRNSASSAGATWTSCPAASSRPSSASCAPWPRPAGHPAHRDPRRRHQPGRGPGPGPAPARRGRRARRRRGRLRAHLLPECGAIEAEAAAQPRASLARSLPVAALRGSASLLQRQVPAEVIVPASPADLFAPSATQRDDFSAYGSSKGVHRAQSTPGSTKSSRILSVCTVLSCVCVTVPPWTVTFPYAAQPRPAAADDVPFPGPPGRAVRRHDQVTAHAHHADRRRVYVTLPPASTTSVAGCSRRPLPQRRERAGPGVARPTIRVLISRVPS